jgi:hypothetical protein
MVSIPLARHHGRRFSVGVDRQSKGGVNFRRTTRRCFSVWLSRSGKAWEDRPGRAVRRARVSRVVTAALLSEVAEVVALPDLRSEVPEDRVRNRNVEEEVG